MEFENIGEFSAFLSGVLPQRIATAKRVALIESSELVLTEIRSEIGHYQSGDAGFKDMAPLSPATLEGFGPLKGKIARGFAPPDNPLLETGKMRDSFDTHVEGDEAVIGSNDPVAIYQNQGTDKRGVPFIKGETVTPGIPAREFIGRSVFRKVPEMLDIISARIQEAFKGD